MLGCWSTARWTWTGPPALELEAAFKDINTLTTQDGQEGVQSFIERRSAAYRGW